MVCVCGEGGVEGGGGVVCVCECLGVMCVRVVCVREVV